MSKYHFQISIPKCLDTVLASPVLAARKIWYGYSFRRIKLIGGKYAIVDQEDFHEISRYNWFAQETPRSYTAVRFMAKGRLMVPVHMHREIFFQKEKDFEVKSQKVKGKNNEEEKREKAKVKIKDGYVVDHINRNGLDNRRANLRLATLSQNSMNRCKCKGTSSEYKGVSWNSARKMWACSVQVEKKTVYLGCFEKEQDAARAYDKAAKKHHGEFAYQNFPQEKMQGLRNIIRRFWFMGKKIKKQNTEF